MKVPASVIEQFSNGARSMMEAAAHSHAGSGMPLCELQCLMDGVALLNTKPEAVYREISAVNPAFAIAVRMLARNGGR